VCSERSHTLPALLRKNERFVHRQTIGPARLLRGSIRSATETTVHDRAKDRASHRILHVNSLTARVESGRLPALTVNDTFQFLHATPGL